MLTTILAAVVLGLALYTTVFVVRVRSLARGYLNTCKVIAEQSSPVMVLTHRLLADVQKKAMQDTITAAGLMAPAVGLFAVLFVWNAEQELRVFEAGL